MRQLIIILSAFCFASCASYFNAACSVSVKDLDKDSNKTVDLLTSGSDKMTVTYDVHEQEAEIENKSTQALIIDKSKSYYIDHNGDAESITNVAGEVSSDKFLVVGPKSSSKIKLPEFKKSIEVGGYMGDEYEKDYNFKNSKLTSQYAFAYKFEGEKDKGLKYWRDGLYVSKSEFNTLRSGVFVSSDNNFVSCYDNKTEVLVCSIAGPMGFVGGILCLSSFINDSNKSSSKTSKSKNTVTNDPVINVWGPIFSGIMIACGAFLSVNVVVALGRAKNQKHTVTVTL